MLVKAISKLNLIRHLAWPVLVSCLLVTFFQAYSEKQKIDRDAIAQFHNESKQVASKIEERLRDYALILRGGIGLFAASDKVTQQEWHTYVTYLNASESVKGVVALSFVQAVPASQLAAHIASHRQQKADYTVSPLGSRAFYAPLVYLAPINAHNQGIIGVDMFTDPVMRGAMEQARDTGKPTMSSVVVLKEDEGEQSHRAVIIYAPLYRQDMPINTVEQRRAAILGWVDGAYYVDDIVMDILNDWPRFKASSAGFHVYDGAVAKADNLIFDITPVHQYEENSPYYYAYPLQFNDRTWLIAFNENPPHQVSYYAAWVVLVSGLVLSGLLFILMQFIIRTQQLAKNIADNLTRRYQHQNQALKESELRWRFAIEEAGDGLWDWNIADNTLFVSARWKAMLGYTEDEIAEGISANGIDQWETRIHPDDKAHTLVALQACLDQKKDIYTSEYRLKCKDGHYKWILDRGVVVSHDDKGKPMRMIGVDNDITERKQREMNAIEYNAQLSAIFDLSPDGFATFNTKRQVSYVNHAFEYLTGLSVTQVVGLDEEVFSHLLVKQCKAQYGFTGIHSLSKQDKFTLGNLNEHAHIIEIDCSPKRVLKVSLIESRADNVSQILYLRDHTQESEVNQLKSEFMATAAHELRTPMTSILGYAELLTIHEVEAEDASEYLQIICRQSKLMTAILDDLLDLSHLEANRDQDFVMSHIELGEVLQEVVASFSMTNHKYPTQLTLAKKPQWINGDRSKIIRVLNNVLSNAYKYSPNGGAVDVTLIAPTRRPKANLEIPAHHVGICITDHGLGMTPMQLTHVYDRFYRADASGKIPGTGLGMSIVKEIIELHGGQVKIDSEIGQGTVVTLWLPVVSAPKAGQT
jgi:PAS domain S-box-containing protein